jgi:cellulose synthase/poly-beta-1,6-N-acetylglucosamine synthase-like glycosyltransferase
LLIPSLFVIIRANGEIASIEVLKMGSSAPESTATCFLSIIVPAYNEEKRLPDSLPQIIQFVRQQYYPIEVIVLDDGSTDRTVEIVRQSREEAEFITLLQVEHGG